MPTKHWHGVSGRTALGFALVASQLAWAITAHLSPQLTVLQDVKDAICAGDRDFVYAVDGMGVVTWSYPPAVEGSIEESSNSGFTPWPFVSNSLTGSERVVDKILDNQGRIECPPTSCFLIISPTLPPFPLPEDGLGGHSQPRSMLCRAVDKGTFHRSGPL